MKKRAFLFLLVVLSGCGTTQKETVDTDIRLTSINISSSYKYPDKVLINWDAIKGVRSYSVWRSTSENADYTEIAASLNVAQCEDRPDAGIQYYYKIKSHFDFGVMDFSQSSLGYRSLAITVDDNNLENVIRAQIKKLSGTIFDGELWDIKEVNYSSGYNDDKKVVRLGGIQYCKNVSTISLPVNQIMDITPLQSLSKLTKLTLYLNYISNLSPLQDLTSLEELVLDANNISSLAPLQFLTNLKRISLVSNKISDITPLQNLSNLKSLDIRWNNMDLRPESSNKAVIDSLVSNGCEVNYTAGNIVQ
ncbi:MAG: hypothetical protein DKM50_12245 [Candidatus Margulisiibacteriota bacterium]|nr:MAG: hypothetical protein DKM50_12245 [Candidatus Margulisiibacteriota bacterium]HCY37342.1 hypothetical protein [Candidatus Margulisiibacteriota bacterium]